MASSDDEGEAQPLSVSNYYFEDDRDAPVCFSVLPIQWSESESPVGKKREVFLRGFVDNGLQKFFVQVVAWRFDLSYVRPEIAVLSKDGRWIKLERARKSYEETIRTILITIHFLSYVKKNPDSSAKSVWDNLSKNKEFRSYEVMPSQKDLLNHMTLMSEAAKRDAVLTKSKLLLMVLEDKDKLKIKKLSDEEVKDLARPGFIIDDMDDGMIDEIGEDSDGEDELFDSVCAICDNGGELLCCDGKCMRSFHANEEDGEESNCASLGFSRKEVDEIQNFYCKNCEYNQHQCFACGTLGCSDKFSGAEVFKCASATCGFFYHPHCVAKLLQGVVEDAPKGLERKISEGGPFTCPTHYCYVCKEMENKKEHDLQFAVCRRCPKSYHRKCLPREISFDDAEDEDIVTRAWEDLLPNNRILIYCLKHRIDDELGTPIRDHIRFPNVKANVREMNFEENAKPATKEGVTLNKNDIDSENLFDKKFTAKVSKLSGKISSGILGDKKSEKISGSNISRKKTNEASRRCLNENKRATISGESRKSVGAENKIALGAKLFAYYQNGSEQINFGNQIDNVANNTLTVKPTKKLSGTLPPLDADSERRLLALFKEATTSITLENVIKEHKFATTHTHSLKNVVEKTITLGKLEGSVEAVRTALRMLEDGHSIRDAEAVCGSDVLNQIFKWKDKLKVYLAPVLYGNRYTSFGRHFTQVEKLEGIVDKLHWYVQNGDTIVDFCCGANDFSILMNKKLEETGKRCSYKNFDLLPTKNDFNFEMRDWMTVQTKELPTGSQLIMGLNPPFGLKAALANKFIDKALEFRPKLLILIVPPETERLDKKRSPYDLVWEDGRFLSGKSFYLPGSVDNNERQIEQWNVKPPPLYLWSRPDWTDKHKAIAREHDHLISQRELSKIGSFNKENSAVSHTMDDDNYDTNIIPDHDILNSTDAPMDEDQPGSSPHGSFNGESQERHEYRVRKAGKTSWKRNLSEENDRRLRVTTSPNPIDSSSVERFQPKPDMLPPDYELNDRGYKHFEPTFSSRMGEIRAAYSGSQNRPTVSNPLYDSGIMDVDEHHSSLLRDTNNSIGYKPYAWEDENYLRELDPRRQTRHYGFQNANSGTSSYVLSGHDPAYSLHMGPSYPARGSLSESPYGMNTPAMQRYAPRLDEFNHVRVDPLGFDPPIVGRNGTFDHNMPQPGYGIRLPGFAAGSHNVYPRQNSADRFN